MIEMIFRPRIQADPISLAIAMRASQRSTVPEGQLAYGFKTKPVDQPRVTVFRNIPEEKLYDINSKVIEFKKPNYSAESEFDIDESDEDFGLVNKRIENKQFDTHCLSYSDIGYSDAIANDRKFVNVPISTTPDPNYVDPNESECTGRVIRIDNEENSYIDQLISELGYLECSHIETMT